MAIAPRNISLFDHKQQCVTWVIVTARPNHRWRETIIQTERLTELLVGVYFKKDNSFSYLITKMTFSFKSCIKYFYDPWQKQLWHFGGWALHRVCIARPGVSPRLQVNWTNRKQPWANVPRTVLHFRTDLSTTQDICGGCRSHLWLVWVAAAWTLDRCALCSPEYVAGLSTRRFGFLGLSRCIGSAKDPAGLPTCKKWLVISN